MADLAMTDLVMCMDGELFLRPRGGQGTLKANLVIDGELFHGAEQWRGALYFNLNGEHGDGENFLIRYLGTGGGTGPHTGDGDHFWCTTRGRAEVRGPARGTGNK